MGCAKRRYRDRIAAELALENTRRKKRTRRDKEEVRAYDCSRCGGWHLTSMER